MATITPTNSERGVGVHDVITWADMAAVDTCTGHEIVGSRGDAGAVQMTGTFGGGLAAMQVSNDGTNWAALKDLQGTAIELDAAGMAEFSTAARYIRPAPATGNDGVTVTVRLCG